MPEVLIDRPELESLGVYEFGWHDADQAGETAQRGLSEDVVRNISALKNEPEWMLQRRLRALKLFDRKPMPTWGADLSDIEADLEGEVEAETTATPTAEKVKPLRMKISKAKERALMKEFGLDETVLTEEEMNTRRQRLKQLIKLGKTRGYLTHAEINDHLPDKLVDAETLEVVIAMLSDMGVAVYEQTPDAETLLLADGRLAVVGPHSHVRSNAYGYWLFRHDAAPRHEVADVRDWILAEAADCAEAMRAYDVAQG